MPAAFLAVLSHPGTLVSLSEFHDWYNNEHIPLRLDHLPSFLTGARFSAIDNRTPSWLALYDVDDTSTFEQESYTRLRTNRSEREGNLVKRLGVLDRRTCEVVWDSGVSGLTSSLGTQNPTRVLISHGAEEGGGKSESGWKEGGGVGEVRRVEGWVRTRVFKCLDTAMNGVDVPSSAAEVRRVPPLFVMHEFLTVEAVEKAVEVLEGVPELRKWELYRAYPSLTQRA
ncbi:hypothetical protein AX17_007288 [Amanita inopinata Kibby_2008]|nr:hypothetical protein AX17_007288 [Amanita inopinata Kibby_2008]